MRCAMSDRLIVAAIAATLCWSSEAGAQQEIITTEREVVSEAVRNNPGLEGALIELRDAQWSVSGEEGRYPWILQVGAGATRTAKPNIGDFAVATGEVYSLDLESSLRKHLRWGTELDFSLTTSWQRSGSGGSSLGTISGSGFSSAPLVRAFTPSYSIAARAGVVQPLLRGSDVEVNLAGLHVARRQQTQAERAAERVASVLLRDVLTAYWELWYAKTVLDIQAQSRALAIAARDEALLRVKTGSLAPADALPFETRVATREEDVVNAAAEVDRQRIALTGRMGVIGKVAIGLPSEAAPPEPNALPPVIDRDLPEQSPELRELAAAVEVARTRRRSAGDANRPRLDADAYVQIEGLGKDDAGAALKQLATFGAVSAHAGLTFESPLDQQRRRADIGRANLTIELSLARLEERRQQVIADVRVAERRQHAARERIGLASRTTAVAERQLQTERQRFETGGSTPLQVLQAEDDARNARLRVVRARVDVLQHTIVAEHLTGRLLARYAQLLPRNAGARGNGLAAASWLRARF
jgi:outer membrane protein TolC